MAGGQESGSSLSPRAETSVPFSLSAQKGELNVVAITEFYSNRVMLGFGIISIVIALIAVAVRF